MKNTYQPKVKLTFSNIPPTQNNTVDEAGVLAPDGNIKSTVYKGEQWNSTQN
jgi:hypothetical protein